MHLYQSSKFFNPLHLETAKLSMVAAELLQYVRKDYSLCTVYFNSKRCIVVGQRLTMYSFSENIFFIAVSKLIIIVGKGSIRYHYTTIPC